MGRVGRSGVHVLYTEDTVHLTQVTVALHSIALRRDGTRGKGHGACVHTLRKHDKKVHGGCTREDHAHVLRVRCVLLRCLLLLETEA